MIQKKELLQKIYTERFRWYDELFIVGLISFMLVLAGQIPGMAFADMLQNFTNIIKQLERLC